MPGGIYERKPLEVRFWEKVNKNGPLLIDTKCWEWTGAKKKAGYGFIGLNYKNYYAHRLAYEFYYKVLPKEQHVLHKCDNPSCVNPEHLFLGSQVDNMKDMNLKNRHAVGEKTNINKLTDKEVIEIRNKYSSGIPNKTLCKEYNVSHATIHRVVYKKLWKHIS